MIFFSKNWQYRKPNIREYSNFWWRNAYSESKMEPSLGVYNTATLINIILGVYNTAGVHTTAIFSGSVYYCIIIIIPYYTLSE